MCTEFSSDRYTMMGTARGCFARCARTVPALCRTMPNLHSSA